MRKKKLEKLIEKAATNIRKMKSLRRNPIV